MTPERLAQIEAWAEENKRGYYDGASAKTILELVAALREAQTRIAKLEGK